MEIKKISDDIKFSIEITNDIECLNKLRENGKTKYQALKKELAIAKKRNDEKAIIDIKAEMNKAYLYQKSISSEDKKIRDKALNLLNKEYREFEIKVKENVKRNISLIKAEHNASSKKILDDYAIALKEINSLDLDKKEYQIRKNGIDIKRKRALKTNTRTRLEEELLCKKELLDVRNEYVRLESEIRLKPNAISNLKTKNIEARATSSFEKTIRDRSFWLSKVSMFCFLILVITYILVCAIGGIKIEYKKILEGSSIIIAVALGGVFIYSMKSFDMSLGGGTALAAAMGAMVWNSTKNMLLVLIVAILIGVAIELINAGLANILNLPVMVTTLAMSSVLSAILSNILENTETQTIKVTGIKQFDVFIFYFGVILALFLFTSFIFKLTPVGRKNKMIGCNSVSSKYTGVNITKQGIITFFIAGIAIGVGATLYIVRSRTISASSCSTIGLDVILAVVFGGMQTTGGPKSKISAAIFGGLTATLISYLLVAIGRVSGFAAITNYESFVKGILFLAIVSLNTVGNRTNRLPAIEMMW